MASLLTHQTGWWMVKSLCGLSLIAALVMRFVLSYSIQFSIPILLAQSLVVLGGLASIWHYLLLKKENKNLETPRVLQTRGGLFSVVRHPMYLCDMLTYTGLYSLGGYLLATPILGLAFFALAKQAKVEDDHMRVMFGLQHETWLKRTKLILPLVY